jgi:hypothetical protein
LIRELAARLLHDHAFTLVSAVSTQAIASFTLSIDGRTKTIPSLPTTIPAIHASCETFASEMATIAAGALLHHHDLHTRDGQKSPGKTRCSNDRS